MCSPVTRVYTSGTLERVLAGAGQATPVGRAGVYMMLPPGILPLVLDIVSKVF